MAQYYKFKIGSPVPIKFNWMDDDNAILNFIANKLENRVGSNICVDND